MSDLLLVIGLVMSSAALWCSIMALTHRNKSKADKDSPARQRDLEKIKKIVSESISEDREVFRRLRRKLD